MAFRNMPAGPGIRPAMARAGRAPSARNRHRRPGQAERRIQPVLFRSRAPSGTSMIRRIAFIHTVAMLVERFRPRFQSELPGADCFHMLDERVPAGSSRSTIPSTPAWQARRAASSWRKPRWRSWPNRSPSNSGCRCSRARNCWCRKSLPGCGTPPDTAPADPRPKGPAKNARPPSD